MSYGISLPAAGQLVTVYALSFAVFSPILAVFTCKLSRVKVLVVGLAVFSLANLLGAFCTHFVLALLMRALAGLGAGLFTPTASAVAVTLAGPDRKNRALATVMLGLSVATAVGTPLGVFLAEFLGWRMIFLFIAVMSACIALSIVWRFPQLQPPPRLSLRDRVRPMATLRVALTLSCTFLVLMGLYVTYTYSSVVFAQATGHQSRYLAILLMVWGSAAIVGSFVGRSADRFGNRVIINGALGVLVLDFVFIYLAGSTLYGALAGIAIWGVCGWAFVIPQQHRLISAAPEIAPVLVALHLTAVYAGTSLSGVIGAIVLQLASPITLALISAGLIFCGWIVSEGLIALERRKLRGSSTRRRPAPSADAMRSYAQVERFRI